MGERGSGSDSSDVGHAIQMGIRGGSQNGGMVGSFGAAMRRVKGLFFSVAL